jgi:hypothetical protein
MNEVNELAVRFSSGFSAILCSLKYKRLINKTLRLICMFFFNAKIIFLRAYLRDCKD